MAKGALALLLEDLRLDLRRRTQATPATSRDGDRWLIAWASISALAGSVLALVAGYHGGFVPLNALAARLPDGLLQWLTVLGDERLAFALALFFSRRHPRAFAALIAAALIGVAFTYSLKPLVSALRPPAVLEADSFNLVGPAHRRGSFPSGHTVTAAIFYGVWVYFVRASWLRLSLVTLAVIVGLSRVAVGVHWPVDVAAGLAGGVTAAWIGVHLAHKGERFGMSPLIHLVWVVLAAVMAGSLLIWNGGYEATTLMQQMLGIAALGYGLLVYWVRPRRRCTVDRRAA